MYLGNNSIPVSYAGLDHFKDRFLLLTPTGSGVSLAAGCFLHPELAPVTLYRCEFASEFNCIKLDKPKPLSQICQTPLVTYTDERLDRLGSGATESQHDSESREILLIRPCFSPPNHAD